MSAEQPQAEVTHNAAEHRFEVQMEGQLAVLTYRLRPGRIIFTHTGVPEQLRGHGIANRLAHAGLEHARAEQLAVVPLCPFVAAYIRHNPEWQPLVAAEGS